MTISRNDWTVMETDFNSGQCRRSLQDFLTGREVPTLEVLALLLQRNVITDTLRR
jgi:hypothetical protein